MRKIILISLALFFCFFVVYADNVKYNRKIKRLHKKMQYELVCKMYEDFSDKKLSSEDLMRIGDAHYYLQLYEQASLIYTKYMENSSSQSIDVDCIERFFYSLLKSSKYTTIIDLYNKYRSRIDFSFRIKNIVASSKFLLNNKGNVDWKYLLVKDSVFKDLCSCYGLGVINGSAVYYGYRSEDAYKAISSDKGYRYISETLNRLKYNNSIKPIIFESFFDNNNKYCDVINLLSKKLKKYFVSNYAVHPNGDYVVFTDFSGSRSNVRLACTKKINGKWRKVKALGFCKHSFDYAMPVMGKGAKRLYFISNSPGGYGGWDIYYSDIGLDGKWGTPVNAGGKINTPGDEMCPYIDNSGSLYFSSDGRPGYGGFDLYKVNSEDNGLVVSNLNNINTTDDDVSCIFNSREDKIYVLTRINKNEQIKAVLKKYSVLDNMYSDFNIPRWHSDTCMAKNEIKLPDKLKLIKSVELKHVKEKEYIEKYKGKEILNFGNNESQNKYMRGVDSADSSNISNLFSSNIHFDFDSYNLKNEGKESIRVVLSSLKNIEEYVFDITGYADTVGNKKYNLWLSEKRAESIGDFIKSECGVKSSNICITAKGEYFSKSNSRKYRRVDFKAYKKRVDKYKLLVTYQSSVDINIEKLASLFNIDEQEISTINNSNNKIIKNGSLITIPVMALHKVSKGETLKGLCKLYSVNIINLFKINNIKNSDELVKAKVLYIPYSSLDKNIQLRMAKSRNINIDIK